MPFPEVSVVVEEFMLFDEADRVNELPPTSSSCAAEAPAARRRCKPELDILSNGLQSALDDLQPYNFVVYSCWRRLRRIDSVFEQG